MSKYALSGRNVGVRRCKSASFGVVVACCEIVEVQIAVIVITSISQGVDITDVIRIASDIFVIAVGYSGDSAPRVVSIVCELGSRGRIIAKEYESIVLPLRADELCRWI